MTHSLTAIAKTVPVGETIACYGPEPLRDAQIIEALLNRTRAGCGDCDMPTGDGVVSLRRDLKGHPFRKLNLRSCGVRSGRLQRFPIFFRAI